MKHILVLVLALMATPALARDIFPALYDVTGVASNDVLNVRTQPSARSQKIGAFGPYETNVEVLWLSDDGRWGRVNTGEQAGWTSMKFLARQPGQTAADWRVGPGVLAARTLRCSGTEPFWSVTLTPGGTLTYAALNYGDGSPKSGGFDTIAASASTAKRGFSGWLDADPIGFTGIISNSYCSDGMSDMDYGLALDLIRSDDTGTFLDAGCCRLLP